MEATTPSLPTPRLFQKSKKVRIKYKKQKNIKNYDHHHPPYPADRGVIRLMFNIFKKVVSIGVPVVAQRK